MRNCSFRTSVRGRRECGRCGGFGGRRDLGAAEELGALSRYAHRSAGDGCSAGLRTMAMNAVDFHPGGLLTLSG